MRYQGRVTRWNDDRGFGYITPHGGGDDLFVPSQAVWWLLGTFVAVLVAAVARGRLPLAVAAACFGMSAVTFVVYALDKVAAKQARWRTREQTLHLLSLAGGWPGALLAQRLLRHKSRKASFLGVFWLTVIANVALLMWMASVRGAAMLQSLLGG